MAKLLSYLVGNIRVYCRVRPLTGGHANNHGTVSNVEEESISLITPTPSKNGKEVTKTFSFNRVFGPSATQGWSFCFVCHFIQVIVTTPYVCFMDALYGFTFRGGLLRYPTSDSFSFGWL